MVVDRVGRQLSAARDGASAPESMQG
jgi:hypothetical protein